MANPFTRFAPFAVRLPEAETARCAVCHRFVDAGEGAIRVRGLYFHRSCASYRTRREHRLSARS
jgi:hypothetical protein